MRIGRSILDSRRSDTSATVRAGSSERNIALREQGSALRSGSPGAREIAGAALERTGPGGTRISRKAPVPQQPATVLHTAPALRPSATALHRYTTARSERVVYYDQPYSISHANHYDHVFRDQYDRLRYRVVWPRYSCVIGYNYGPYHSYRYHHPYYHRKYLFVSLGGYWPLNYTYRRYYWYGYHPYTWYGYYPIAREVQTDSYNYYTYNYYDNDAYQPAPATERAVFEQLGQQPAEPDEVTLVDTYFEEAVKGFEAGNYDQAVEKFARAMELAPNDMVLPFAYSQALVANGQYSQAAQVLRAAIAKVTPDKEGVFYPRGLYPKEELLLAQIDDLADKAELFSSDADLQLLLGYQLLGIGQVDQALAPLMFAGRDMVNAEAAGVMIRLLEKIKTSNAEAEGAAPGQGAAPGSVPAPSRPVTPAPTQSPISVPFPGPAQGKATIEPFDSSSVVVANQETMDDRRGTRHEKGTLLATLCAVGAGAGIRHFGKC